jgi:hypothetical protein
MKTPRSRSRRSRRWFASHMSVAIIPIRGHRQSSPRLPRAKLIGDDHHELEQLQVESEDTREFASAFSRDVSKMSEWRQNGSLEIPSRLLKSQMERVKGIEPSYSAWKSPDFRNVFKSRSDISQLSGRLRSLRNFSLSECSIGASFAQLSSKYTSYMRPGKPAASHLASISSATH